MAQDQKSICKDLKPCRLVLDRTVDSCRTAFQEYIAEKAGFFWETFGGVGPKLPYATSSGPKWNFGMTYDFW